MTERVRIAIPEPTAGNPEYTERSWPQYAQAVEACGAEAVRIPLAAPPDVQAKLVTGCAGVVLPGSPADVNPEKYGEEAIAACAKPDPARDATDELLLQDAFNLHKPILAICYGLQSMNVWKGGSLVQDLAPGPVNHKPGREVRHAHVLKTAPEGNLASLIRQSVQGRECWANSSHHQAVRSVGDGLRAVAWSDPDGVIEAVEASEGGFTLGLQWHPERTADTDPLSQAIFRRFVDAAGAWQRGPGSNRE